MASLPLPSTALFYWSTHNVCQCCWRPWAWAEWKVWGVNFTILYYRVALIYTTIGIDRCTLGVDTTSITAKLYILQKVCFQGICSKFLGFWHGHGYFWPLRLLRLLEAKNGQNPSSEGLKSLKEWIFLNTCLIKVAHQTQNPLADPIRFELGPQVKKIEVNVQWVEAVWYSSIRKTLYCCCWGC